MRSQDRFRGCLIGGAAGDALGYAVEFIKEREIDKRYGRGGITAYDLTGGLAQISDDTQMTLFTADGLLLGTSRGASAAERAPWINRAYLDWLVTQDQDAKPAGSFACARLMAVPELYSRRVPGVSCLSALRAGGGGTPEDPINDSKGCGGVMRVAPVGLYFADRDADVRAVCRLGAEAAALTHGHPLGWIPGAALAQIVFEVSRDGTPIAEAARSAVRTAQAMWPASPHLDRFTELMEKALDLAAQDLNDRLAIHRLGEGWVAEETLAIAVYCAVKYAGDIDRTLIASVNHNGDSDSTGAVAGNIAGAQVGLSGIPDKYTECLELRDLILQVADDLWADRAEAAGETAGKDMRP